eukprot:TRINITY_DN9271_c0_g1_i1.p1 TRINITY_DN9271_c0_g1~~TRINITY_DN9271_c0_g1_i1.p1  ORF type:complete len:515 (+),score=66.98 TRINITY_DN9271_c0_g1_i1:38-1582(+)
MFQYYFIFFFSSRRRHTRSCLVSWARRCVQETVIELIILNDHLTDKIGEYILIHEQSVIRSEAVIVKRILQEQMQIQADNIIQLYNYTLKALSQDDPESTALSYVYNAKRVYEKLDVPEETLTSSMWYYTSDVTEFTNLKTLKPQFYEILLKLTLANRFYHLKYIKLLMGTSIYYYTQIIVNICEDKCQSGQYVQYVYPAETEQKYDKEYDISEDYIVQLVKTQFEENAGSLSQEKVFFFYDTQNLTNITACAVFTNLFAAQTTSNTYSGVICTVSYLDMKNFRYYMKNYSSINNIQYYSYFITDTRMNNALIVHSNKKNTYYNNKTLWEVQFNVESYTDSEEATDFYSLFGTYLTSNKTTSYTEDSFFFGRNKYRNMQYATAMSKIQLTFPTYNYKNKLFYNQSAFSARYILVNYANLDNFRVLFKKISSEAQNQIIIVTVICGCGAFIMILISVFIVKEISKQTIDPLDFLYGKVNSIVKQDLYINIKQKDKDKDKTKEKESEEQYLSLIHI